MRIRKISLNHLRNEEWFQFFTEFKTLAGDEVPESITDEFQRFLELYNDADEVLEQIRKSEYTAQIAQADVERDTTFSGFRDVVKGMQSHFNPEKRRAAARLMVVFDQYGNIARKPYSDQTASTYNFLQEMKGGFAADVAALELGEWVNELDENNQQFSDLILQRNEEESQKTNLKMIELRKRVEDSYVIMVRRLEAVTVLQADHDLTDLINKLNANVTRYKNMLAQRQGRAAQKNMSDDPVADAPTEE